MPKYGSNPAKGVVPRPCEVCGETFQPYRSGQTTCTRACYNRTAKRAEQYARADAKPGRRERANMLRNSRRNTPEESAKQRAVNLWRNYRLTPEDFGLLLASQGGRCAVCRTDSPGGRNWHVDHNHACCGGVQACGRCIRGVLCTRCNVALGYADDDPARLRALADYLERS